MSAIAISSEAIASSAPLLAIRERGAGEPLALLHGLGSSGRYWGDMQPLAARYCVLAPDLLGFGRSPQPPRSAYGPAEHMAALRRTLAARVTGPFHLVGHSMGAVLALHYAARHPAEVRRVALVSLPVVDPVPWGHRGDGLPARWHRFAAHTRQGIALFESGRSLVRPLWDLVGPALRRDIPAAAARDALAGSWAAYWRTLESVVYGAALPDLMERVSAPITFIHGGLDRMAPIEPVRRLAAAYGLPLVVIAGAGHNPWYTHRAATARVIEQALSG